MFAMDDSGKSGDKAAPAFRLHYVPTAVFYRRALRNWLWHSYGGVLAAALVVALAALVLARTHPWLSGFFAGVLATFAGNYGSQRRGYLAEVERLKGESIELRLEREGMVFAYSRGESRLPWSDLARVDRAPAAWILRVRSRAAPSFVPRECFDAAAEAFFRDRLAEHRVPLVER